MHSNSIFHLCALLGSLTGLAGCGSGGGAGGGSPPQPQFINGTSTGQFQSNDLGFFLGASTVPATITTSTVSPKLRFDIGNGFSTSVSNVHWKIQKNGIDFTSGVVPTLDAFGFTTIDVPISAAPGTSVYHIVIDDVNAFSESNENNNFVDFTVSVPASA